MIKTGRYTTLVVYTTSVTVGGLWGVSRGGLKGVPSGSEGAGAAGPGVKLKAQGCPLVDLESLALHGASKGKELPGLMF